MVAATSRKTVAKHRDDRELRSTSATRWEKKMSNNCATALLVYTLMQIFFVLSFIQTKGMSIAPYFGLVLLVAVIVPFCRKYEKRWQGVANSGLGEQSLAARFRRDQVTLWILALGLPFVFVGIIKIIGAII
ncbi:hypothetical protein [Parasphingorhabdus cellanae]|uniref:Uncharacterized protein n=1 Tax=Parasphingorhabdus cellanae TaxID=2806553 RepID=A0ABX7T6K4_9SPHN|nr:hypothetical protein [Parasphingorhabdus cellanae]QTD56756.1 hypothetical protein J4G78_04035 [Parasphingorhabdus cellanae]